MPRHLYVHIPFCHRICPYCSFHKHLPGDTNIAAFVDSLLAELEARVADHPTIPRTIYFGGGTPSFLSRAHLRTLLQGIHDRLNLSSLEEWNLEANPATFDLEKALLLRELGVTRLSLGVQSWDPGLLGVLGRDHSPEDATSAFTTLREAGFDNINVDLMFSVPGQTTAQWEDTLEKTLSLEPEHVSAYNLTYEEDTEFMEKFRRGVFTESEDENARLFDVAMERLESAGFRHYEISNYSRPGYESAHNRAYWNGEDYLGIGPGAVSTIAGRRWKNIADTAQYIQKIRETAPVISETEELTTKAAANEAVALQLRTAEGLALERAPHLTEADFQPLIEEELLARRDERLVLTRRGKFVADAIAEQLLA